MNRLIVSSAVIALLNKEAEADNAPRNAVARGWLERVRERPSLDPAIIKAEPEAETRSRARPDQRAAREMNKRVGRMVSR